MRPVRLDMDGFASFREPTTVDFTDVEYFALVGPTGAGKSTVIDALTFALFGTVPRWDNKKSISNALAPTAARGTVRLIFDLDGDRYVAARELRRTRQGVQQKNIRLERFDDPDASGEIDDPTEVLAADSQVTPAVEQLLGLSFEHFTQSVVLPQGEFAKFLRAKSAERRSMLLELLGADIYFTIGKAANSRAKSAGERAELLADQVTRFGDATAEAEATAQRRADQLKALVGMVDETLPHLAASEQDLRNRQSVVQRLTVEHEQLTALRRPDGLPELHARLQETTATLEDARRDEEVAQDADADARRTLQAAPARGPLEQARRDHGERDRLRGRLPAAQRAVSQTAAERTEATSAAQRAAEALERERQRRDRAAESHRAAEATVQRLSGEVGILQTGTVPDALPAVDQRLRAAEHDLRTAGAELRTAEQAEERSRAALEQGPERVPLERALSTVRELAAARADLQPYERARDDAEAELATAESARADAAEQLKAARAHRDSMMVAQQAAALRGHLVVGEACPVCEQTVSVLSAPPAVPELDAAERVVAAADAALTRAGRAADAAAGGAAEARARLKATTERISGLTDALGDRPADEAALVGELARLDALATMVRDAGRDVRDARAAREAATNRVNAAEADAGALRRDFVAVRDPLVPLGAPAGTDQPLLQAWTALAAWAEAEAATRATDLAAARRAEDAAVVVLADAEHGFAAAEDALGTKRARENAAHSEHSSAVTSLQGLEQRLAELDQSLAEAPGPDDIAVALDELDRLESAARAAGRLLDRARAAHRKARANVEAVTGQERAAWQRLRSARDPLVSLGAPELPAGSLLDGWSTLLEWAAAQAAARTSTLPDARQAVAAAAEHRDRLTRELTQLLATHLVPLEPGSLAQTAPAAVAAASAAARAAVDRIAERRAQSAELADQRAAAVAEQQVARMLGNLLRTDKFPEWLESAALDTLVEAASEILADLSGGQFELTHRDGDFYVVDHADADSLRSVRTLSGGETFQASLALALALSSQLSALAAEGAARLDSIFLDEGFGTLDENTLEVVAGTLENLASGDRMVGVITHVTALAERAPVRYAVRRDSRTSTIIRETA